MSSSKFDSGGVPQEVREAERPLFDVAEATEASAKHPERNEDASYADPERGLIALSDGAGGHAGGDVVSRAGMAMAENPYQPLFLVAEVGEDSAAMRERLAFEAMVKEDQSRLKQIEAQLSAEEERDGAVSVETANACMDTLFRLSAASVEASSKTFAAKARREGKSIETGKEPMATLMMARVFETAAGKKALVRSVGDSAGYVRRADGTVERLDVVEDSELQKWVADQDLTQAEADEIAEASNCDSFSGAQKIYCTMYFGTIPAMKNRAASSMVTQMAGHTAVRELDVHQTEVDVGDGDELFFTSDGIHDNLTTAEIAEIMGGREPFGERAKRLVSASVDRSLDPDENNLRPKKDDMTVVALRTPEAKREPVGRNLSEGKRPSAEDERRAAQALNYEFEQETRARAFLEQAVRDLSSGSELSETDRNSVDFMLENELGAEAYGRLSAQDKLDQLRLLISETEKRALEARRALLRREMREFDRRFPMRFNENDAVRVPRSELDPATGQPRLEAGWTVLTASAGETYRVVRTGPEGKTIHKNFFREDFELSQAQIKLRRGDTFSIVRSSGELDPGWTYQGPNPKNPGEVVMTKETPKGLISKAVPSEDIERRIRAELGEQNARRRRLEAADIMIEDAKANQRTIARGINERKLNEVNVSIREMQRVKPDYFLTKDGQAEAREKVVSKQMQIDTLRRRYPGQPDAEAMVAKLEAERDEMQYWLTRKEVESRRVPALFEWMLKMPMSEREVMIGDGKTGLLEAYDAATDTYRVRDERGKAETMFREQLDLLSSDQIILRSGMRFVRTFDGVPKLFEVVRIMTDKQAVIAAVPERPNDAIYEIVEPTSAIRQSLKRELRDGWQARYDLKQLEKKRQSAA